MQCSCSDLPLSVTCGASGLLAGVESDVPFSATFDASGLLAFTSTFAFSGLSAGARRPVGATDDVLGLDGRAGNTVCILVLRRIRLSMDLATSSASVLSRRLFRRATAASSAAWLASRRFVSSSCRWT